ncbi:MAG: beta-hydroxyacyl-ACP dehydratase [Planctomycetes bacterium]|nr:beta-hydroxyacyl-ACP dehydratase [Planctomycetota bacterium]
MRFSLVDHIIELTRGERIIAVKAVSLAEEYLADHFPTFPVLPGVFILQALVESASWLVRDAQDFPSRLILLRNVKNVTYKSFVKPGSLLRLEVSCRRLARDDSDFEGVGYCQDMEISRGKFGLVHVDPADDGRVSDENARIAAESRKLFDILR